MLVSPTMQTPILSVPCPLLLIVAYRWFDVVRSHPFASVVLISTGAGSIRRRLGLGALGSPWAACLSGRLLVGPAPAGSS
eukprot:s683_g17.t1